MPSESDKWGWKHVSVFGGFDKGSGTKRWKCNYCNLRYNGSYSRVRAHLLGFTGVGVKGCPAIDRSLRQAFLILEEERLARTKKRISGSGKSSKHIRSSQPTLACMLKAFAKEDVDDVIARFFYADGLNLSIINSLYFHDMAKAIAAFGPGYEPPSMEKLSSSLLSKERARIDKTLVPVRESWSHTGCTILCLSRLDATLSCFSINIFVSSQRGLIFFKTIDINEGEGADHVFTEVLCKVIMEVGPTNVLQIIVHPARSSKFSETLIQSKFPQIFWSPCASHSIHMLLEGIAEAAELDWIRPIVLCAKGIEHCILTHQQSLPHTFSQSLIEESFDPISAKFAPSYHLVWRILRLKQALQEMAVGEEWRRLKLTFPEEILSVEAAILGNEFWDGAHLMLQLYEPFVRSLSSLNVDRPVMGDVYSWRVQAVEEVRSKGLDEMVLKLEELLENRWEMLFSPLVAAGYILNPRYFGKGQTKDKTIMRGWKTTLERYECDGSARRALREQLSSYWRLEGSLGDEDAVDCRDKMDPVAWWENFGSETPELQTLAIKILSQISSVPTFQESLHDKDSLCRESVNRLGAEQAEDLLFVRNNLRLHGRKYGNSSVLSGVKTWDAVPVDQIKGAPNTQNKL